MSTHDRDDADGPVAVLAPAEEQRLVDLVRAAWAPSDVDPATHERLLEQALEDPFAAPSEEEIAESARLREALEGRGEHAGASLARALVAATAPAALPAKRGERLVARSLERAPRSNVFFVSFGGAALLAALAAAVALWVRPAERADAPMAGLARSPTQPLAISRSTASLFDEKFETAATTLRIERISAARERDLRQNRYALWGVR